MSTQPPHRARGRRGDPWSAAAVCAALLAVVAATNKWLSWDHGLALLKSRDELSYRAIATAAPGLPDVRLPEQHAQRWAPHWVIGVVSDALGLGVPTTYEIVALAVAVGLTAALARFAMRLGLRPWALAVCVGVVVLNAYALRYYALAPGQTGDLLFELAALGMLAGLLTRRLPLVLGGALLAVCARQTAVPVVLVAAVWCWLAVGRSWPTGRRAAAAGAVLVLPVALYVVLVSVARGFAAHTTPGLTHFTVLGDVEHLPSGAGALGQHLLRCVNGLFAVLALLASSAVVARRRDATWRPPAELWGCLAVAAAIALQPVVFSAGYAAHNETRLAVLALPTLAIALALLLVDVDVRAAAPVVLVLLAVGSLHHLYTRFGPADATQSVVLQFLTAAGCAAVVLARARLTPGAADPGPADVERPGAPSPAAPRP